MNDGNWEAVRGSHRNPEGSSDPKPPSAAAVSDSRAAHSGVTQSADVIIGWRVWGLSTGTSIRSGSRTDQPLLLVSVYMNSVWQPGKIMLACCSENSVRHGIHAFKTSVDALAYINEARKPIRYVFGEVSLWGRVVVHDRGYRAGMRVSPAYFRSS